MSKNQNTKKNKDNMRIDSLFKLDFTYKEIIEKLTLTNEERDIALNQKMDYNKVGYAVNILLLKSMSIMVNDLKLFKEEHKESFEYICRQVNVNSSVDVDKYCNKTYLKQRANILKNTGYRAFKENDEMIKKAFNIAMSTSSRFEMIRDFIEYLKNNKVILPKRYKIEKIINSAVKNSDEYIYKRIVEQVQCKELVERFISTDYSRLSDFNTVKNLGANKNEKNKRRSDIEKKIEILEKYDFNVDLKFMHVSKREKLYEQVRDIKRENIARIKDENKRIVYILIFIKLYKQNLINELIIYDRGKYNKKTKKLITVKNINLIYERFINKVIVNKNIENRYKMEVFIQLMINGCNGYKEVCGKYVLNNYNDIYINKEEYDTFKKEIILGEYTSEENKLLISNIDMIIEKDDREKTGSYYTESMLVDTAHKLIIQEYGYDWYDKYTVYDCAAGTNNLTKNYKFRSLYTSTLENQELEASKMYNKEAVKFRYDFLNDREDELPDSLLEKLKNNEKLIFFINPPYKKLEHINTKIGYEMASKNLGASSKQLITQFLYRILKLKNKYKLTNVHIVMFSDVNFMQRPWYKTFRDKFLNHFDFRKGALFDSKYFNGVSSNWPVSLNMWDCKSNTSNSKNYFRHELIEYDREYIDKLKFKIIYNTDNIGRLGDWVKDNIKSCDEDGVAYFENLGYKVEENNICKISEEETRGSIKVGQDNISIISSIFAARRLIKKAWGCGKNTIDNYLVPNLEHWYYEEWNKDARVYMIFHESTRESIDILGDNIFVDEYYKKLIDKSNISKESKELLIEVINVANTSKKWTKELDILFEKLSKRMEQYVYVLGFLK